MREDKIKIIVEKEFNDTIPPIIEVYKKVKEMDFSDDKVSLILKNQYSMLMTYLVELKYIYIHKEIFLCKRTYNSVIAYLINSKKLNNYNAKPKYK